MKLTPWFPHRIKPVHVGVYQIKTDFGQRWCYWNGSEWGWNAVTADVAEALSARKFQALQKKVWRGRA